MRKLLLTSLILSSTFVFAQKAVVVIVNGAPLAEHLSATSSTRAMARERLFQRESEDYRAALRREKAPLLDRIAQRGLTVRWQTETVLNAIMIESATEEDLAWLRTLPGVKKAEFGRTLHPHLDAATTLIGAPQVWTQLGGADQTGRGVKVAVMDSGIDVTHPMFSDSGFTAPAGFPKFDNATNQTYTNGKVIVAKNYVCPVTGSCAALGNTADRNASDGLGHGTFVASVIGGRAVPTPAGPTISGVSPGVYLGSYKVFSSGGSSEFTAELTAINDAVTDGMDIINFSGGGDPGGTKPLDDIDYDTIHNAASLGVVMVFSAGNCGPLGGGCGLPGDSTVGDPAIQPDAISVGATTNSRTFSPQLKILGPGTVPANLQSVNMALNSMPSFTSFGPATLVDSVAVDPTRQLCTAPASGTFTGNIVLVQARGSCTTPTKVSNAAKGGAAAMVMYDNLVESLGGFLSTGGTIPSVTITSADGANLIAYLKTQPGGLVAKLDALANASQTADQVANYSSRGPNTDYSIKPDLVAPGDMYAASQTLYPNAEIYDASKFLYAEGTSFAAPMTTGSAAALKGARPTLTARDIKSALVNSSSPITATQEGSVLSVMSSGAGRLNLLAAMTTTLVADPVSVSFGVVPLGPLSSTSASIQLKNVGSANETFTVAVAPSVSSPGLNFTVDKTTVTLAAGATTALKLSAASATAQGGEFEGFLTLQSQTSPTLVRIPYWIMFGPPKLASGGLVDAASFGKLVAPGEIVTVFGSGVGGAPTGSSVIPLPKEINHTRVFIVARSASAGQDVTYIAIPMFFASPGQLNFQMPFTESPDREGVVLTTLQGVVSNAITFQMVAVAPQIFAAADKSGVVTHGLDNSPISSTSPAAANEVVVIYCTGLGTVTPAVGTGAAAPSNPPSTAVVTPTVTIGGKNAVVQFAGLTPGLAGLYQVNVVVPSGLTPGPQSVVMTSAAPSGTRSSNSVTTFVK